MAKTIDYYLAPQSPWTYLGHQRLRRIAAAAGATINVMPVDLGQVFPVSGGLPLPKRAPQRQAYRLVELKRFSRFLGLPMVIQPRHFPVPGDPAAQLIVAVDQADGAEAAMEIAGRILAAVWEQERDISDEATLAALLSESGLAADRLDASKSDAVRERYAGYTKRAIDAGVFGAPSVVIDGELFWGQDRLDFVERALKA